MSLCSRLRIDHPGGRRMRRMRRYGPADDGLAALLRGVPIARIAPGGPVAALGRLIGATARRWRDSLAAARLPWLSRVADPAPPSVDRGPAGPAALPAQAAIAPPLPPIHDLAGLAWRGRIVAADRDAETALRIGRARLFLVAAGFGLAFAIVGIRLADSTLLRDSGSRVAAAADPGWRAARADIIDRNGQVLATSVVTASLFADAREVIDPRQSTQKLLSVLPELNARKTIAALSSKKAFVWLYRNLTPRQHQLINDLGIPGLYFRTKPRRVYPHGALAAHSVGFVDPDDRGLAGIERRFDTRLRDSGAPVRLTLDMRVQHMLREEVARSIRRFDALGGAGIVLDADTAEIIAMVSLPDFDPAAAGGAARMARFNKVTLGTYEMGSTFKIFTTAMALNSGRIRLTDRFDATRPIRISRFEINDLKPKAAWLSVRDIFRFSSNIGSARIAIEIGKDEHRQFLRTLGLLTEPGIQLPEVAAPQIPSHWQDITTMTVAFGHGLSVSPLQLANAVAAMVNGGQLRQPRLVAGHPGDGAATEAAAPIMSPEGMSPEGMSPGVVSSDVISPEVSARIRQLMRLVVTDGTGRRADAPGYRVGGKTGTAEKSAGQRGYRRKALISSFVAAFPMDRPRYVVFAMLDEPTGTKETHGHATGGWVAAPIISRFVTRAAPLLGVEPVLPPGGNETTRRPAADIDRSGRRILTAYSKQERLSPDREGYRAPR